MAVATPALVVLAREQLHICLRTARYPFIVVVVAEWANILLPETVLQAALVAVTVAMAALA